jgi:hypothetical protein
MNLLTDCFLGGATGREFVDAGDGELRGMRGRFWLAAFSGLVFDADGMRDIFANPATEAPDVPDADELGRRAAAVDTWDMDELVFLRGGFGGTAGGSGECSGMSAGNSLSSSLLLSSSICSTKPI